MNRRLCIEAFYQWIFIGVDYFEINFHAEKNILFSLYCSTEQLQICEDRAADQQQQQQTLRLNEYLSQYVSSTFCYAFLSLFLFHAQKHLEQLIHCYLECLWQWNEYRTFALNTIQLIEYILGLTPWLCFNLGLLHWQKRHQTEGKFPPLQQISKCFWRQWVVLIYSVYKICSRFCFPFCFHVIVSQDDRDYQQIQHQICPTEGAALVRRVRAFLSKVFFKNTVILPS